MVVKYRFRLYLFTLAVLCGFTVLVYRLWTLQIDRYAEFVKQVPGAKELRARIPGVRGEIKDRNGIVLATNKASFEVRVDLEEVMDEFKRLVKAKKETMPYFEYTTTERGLQRKASEVDIDAIFKKVIQARLNDMGLAAPYNSQALRVHFRSFRGVIPWVYRDDLTFAEFSRFAEHNVGLPGVSVAERATRLYPYGALACHILGYVRLPDDKRVSAEERKGWDFYVPDDFGGAGVEKSFDNYLKGKPGVRTMKKDERGRMVGQVSYEEPRKGDDVFLTIDARIQTIAERALRDGKVGRGAVVVIEPGSGEILAMASVPSYDPNKFIPSIRQSDWDELLKNRTIPLLNRAVRGYAPGSTYKIPISFAGCLADIQMRRFVCSGGVTYGKTYMKCWIGAKGGAHGSLSLSDAIMRSCNSFYYQYGNEAGINNITRVGQMLGLGERTGVELDDEEPGILPNPQWLRVNRPRERWSSGFTANTSIGQGFVLASPLQMASVVSTVANGGKAYIPHLLKRVLDGNKLVLDNKPELRADLSSEVSEDEIEMIRRGMWKVVNDSGGTARGARIDGVEVAGKTGTAQNWRLEKGVKTKDNHAWFISFAPYQNPKFAVCVLVQGGNSGGGCGAPVARRVLEQSLALENGFEVAVEPLSEAVGSFDFIQQVTYADSGIPDELLASDEEADAAVVTAPAVPVAEAAPRIRNAPTIRQEADRQGSEGVSSSQAVPRAVPVRRAPIFSRGGGDSPASSESSSSSSEPEPRRGLLRRLFR
jgi:penicillin-binding protein 2